MPNLSDNGLDVYSVSPALDALAEAEADALESLGLLLSAERASWPASIRVYSTASELLKQAKADLAAQPATGINRHAYTTGFLASWYEQLHAEYCELASRVARAEAERDNLRDLIANADVIPY